MGSLVALLVAPRKRKRSPVGGARAHTPALRLRLVVLLSVLGVAFALQADADDTPAPAKDAPTQVRITRDGPLDAIPFNKPLYLTGDPEDGVDRVQAFIVRKGAPWFWGDHGASCDKLSKQLQDLAEDKQSPGIHDTAKLLDEANAERRASHRSTLPPLPEDVDRILVTAAWEPSAAKPATSAAPAASPGATAKPAQAASAAPATSATPATKPAAASSAAPLASAAPATSSSADAGGAKSPSNVAPATANASDAPADKPFKVFVPATASDHFFLPERNYCVLVFQHNKKTTTDPLADVMLARVRAEEACKSTHEAASDLCESKSKACVAGPPPAAPGACATNLATCTGNASTNETACRNTAKDAFESKVRDLVAKRQKDTTSPARQKAADAAHAKFATPTTCSAAEVTGATNAAWTSFGAGPALPAAKTAQVASCASAGPEKCAQKCADDAAAVAEQERAVVVADDAYVGIFKDVAGRDLQVKKIARVLDFWSPPPGTSKVTDPSQVQATALNAALKVLLTRQDRLSQSSKPDAKSAALLDHAHASVTRPAAPAGAAKVKAAPPPTTQDLVLTDDLLVPNTTVSFRDLVELTFGRIRVDGDYKSAEEVHAMLKPALTSKNAGLAPEQAAVIHAVHDQLTTLHVVVERVVAEWKASLPPPGGGAAPPAPPAGSDLDIEQKLGAWLAPALVPCASGPLGATACTCGPTNAPRGWNGYCGLNSPLSAVADALRDFENDQDAVVRASASDLAQIKTSFEITAPATVVLSVRNNEFTQQNWVSAYLTPVVGAAIAVPKGSVPIIQPYAGVQLHLSASPVDDPLWSHGTSDFRRAFAFEVGLVTNNGTFGTDNRFRGPGNFAPVLVGAVIHLIPYTSVGGGVSVFDARSSTVTQQQFQTTALPYVAVNVQANIPDLIRFGIKGGSANVVAASGGSNP